MFISVSDLKTSIEMVEEKALSDHYFIMCDYIKELYAVTHREGEDIDMSEGVEMLYESYSSYYLKQDIFLEVRIDGQIIGSNFPSDQDQSMTYEDASGNTRKFCVIQRGNNYYVRVYGGFPNPYERVTLIYYYDCSDIMENSRWMTNSLYRISGIIALLLSMVLLALVEYIFKPFQQVSDISKNIAKGNYNQRILIKGKDEVAEMADNFNLMSEQIESQLNKLVSVAEEKQHLVDNLAHELRTPFTAIYGYAENIYSANISEEKRQRAVKYIMSETKRVKNIADRLLKLAVLREGGELEVFQVDLYKLLHKAQETLAIKAKTKNISIKLICDIKTLICNGDLIESIVLNLGDNAIKATKEEGEVYIKAYEEEDKKIIEIEDFGKGMTEEQLEHITEAFYRVDKARSRAEGGAGLGLTLCKKIVLLHGAKLEFSSQINKGTQARIIFTSER